MKYTKRDAFVVLIIITIGITCLYLVRISNEIQRITHSNIDTISPSIKDTSTMHNIDSAQNVFIDILNLIQHEKDSTNNNN